MKFSLRKRAAAPRAKAPEEKAPARKDKGIVTLGRLISRAFLAGAVIVVAAAAAVHTLTVMRADVLHRQQVEVSGASLAKQVAFRLQRYAEVMDVLVRDAALRQVFRGGNPEAVSAKEAELSSLFPSALKLRLLPPGVEQVDTSATPHLSYACLAMLRDAETSDKPVAAEVHLLGTPQQHIALARRAVSADGGEVVGSLLVDLAVPLLQQTLDQAGLGQGYVELRQSTADGKELVLAASGNRSLQQAPPAIATPVDGTHWRLAYWPAPVNWSLLSPEQITFWGLVLAAVVLLALVIYMLNKVITNLVRNDLVSIINLVRDLAGGKVKRDYPVRLHSFRGTAEVLSRMAHEFRRGVGVSAAAAAHGADSADLVVDSLEADLMFEGGDPLAMEVVEEPVTEARVSSTIFKAYDIRGIVGSTLDAHIAHEIGRAIGSEAYERGQQSIIVARDGRLSGPEISGALIKGLRATGRDVIDIGQVPTPVLYFATQYLNTGSGVMVTGSHNPTDYNGFKIVLRNETLASDAIQGLRRRIETGNFLAGEGGLESVDVVPDYIERITSDVRIAHPMKVVADCGNGVAGEIAPRLLRTLGCDVVELYCEIDGRFPNHHPDPSQPENLRDLIKAVRESGAAVGLAFDGDGDRLGVVDAEGTIIWPDRQMMLYARDILSRHPGATIIYDVKCSSHLGAVIQQYGGAPLMWKTGHSLVKAKMVETGALLAGEMSGHIFFKERWFGFDDALYTCARLLEVLAADGRPSNKVFGGLPNMVNTPELRIEMAEGEHFRFMERLLSHAQFEGAVLTTIDGLRADFEDGWGLVRASNTTPCLVLRFEGKSAHALKRIQDEFRRLILGLNPSLSIPF